jgi:hypothetical protein
MKNTIVFTVIILLIMEILSSCNSSNVASNGFSQKRKYSRGYFVKNKGTCDDKSKIIKTQDVEFSTHVETNVKTCEVQALYGSSEVHKADVIPLVTKVSAEQRDTSEFGKDDVLVENVTLKNDHQQDSTNSKPSLEEKEKMPHDPLAKFSFGLFILGILLVLSEQLIDPTNPTVGFIGLGVLLLSFILAVISMIRKKSGSKKTNTLFARIVFYSILGGSLILLIAGIVYVAINGFTFSL